MVVGDALSLPYADETFDCVIASEILEHIPEDDAAIAELVRVLKVGGTLAVTRAAVASRADVLVAVRRIPQQRGRPRADLPGQCSCATRSPSAEWS